MAIGKRLKAGYANIDRNKFYSLDEAVSLIKGGAKAKFDETIEIALNLGVDPRHADQMVRGVIELPHGTGKTVRVAVFAKADKGGSPQGRRRRRWCRRPGREDSGRLHGFRPLHRHPRHDGCGRSPR